MADQHRTASRRPTNPRFIDLTGRSFSRLTVISFAESRKSKALWNCLCQCGRLTIVVSGNLNSGVTKSCGCLQKERSSIATIALNISKGRRSALRTKTNRSYAAAKDRCTNPKNNQWKNYGGRGIEFRFSSFAEFIADVGECPSRNMSIDRKETNGHYEAGNLKWSTAVEQTRGRRNTILVPFCGGMVPLIDAASMAGISYGTVYMRIRNGWSIEKSLSTPVRAMR